MRIIFFLALYIFAGSNITAQTNFHANPTKVKLVTEDIPRFWNMMDVLGRASSKNDSIQIIQTQYLDKASAGLKQLSTKKNYAFTAEDMYYTIRAYSLYLNSIRKSSLQIDTYKEKIYTAFGKLKKIYPAARFPDFYFAVGVFNSGGTGVPAGMFIGAEIETADKNSPLEKLPKYLQTGVKTVDKIHLICSHELIHFQQYDSSNNLLGAAIHEGVCDFIGELISGGLINEYQVTYGNEHEKELWEAFKKEMNGKDYSKWLYNGNNAKDIPADMGYYIGYKICSSYYHKAPDKSKALHDLLTFTNAQTILDNSDYENSFKTKLNPIEASSYTINCHIKPDEKKINFKTIISIVANNPLPDTLKLLLHKDSKIEQVKLNNVPTFFELVKADKPANRYMPESATLLIAPKEKLIGKIDITLDYETVFNELKQNNSNFTNEWISLASYSSWYPVNYEWGSYTYEIDVKVPDSFKVTGTGNLQFKNGRYHLSSAKKVADMVLIASTKLQTKFFNEPGTKIRIDYIDYSEEKADSIINGTIQAYTYFKEIFGKIDSADLTIVSTPTKGNSAFSRKDFIYMQTKGQSGNATLKTICHEIGHFWWNKGGDNMEDWLSESFAEFSTLLFTKKYQGIQAYEKRIADYKKQTEGLEPIWGLNRSSNNASLILYYKGSVILHDFMNFIGEEKFIKLLFAIHARGLGKTEQVLQLTESAVSKEASVYLENLLKS
ncbi:MAG: hypothetical protein K2X37_03720 [Chitinophagaceae bacterium]|nr:hypothetical protein [Chitinophagaceae bacterium]